MGKGSIGGIMNQAVATTQESAITGFTPSASCGFYFDVQKFAHAQRVANMFSQSSMVPEQFRNNIGNCLIALNLADRFKLDPFMVMQKMYIVHGKPGIEAQLAIALINASGKFTPLEFELSGEGDNRQCFAFATKKADGKLLKGPVVSIKMAKDEGWFAKSGSKWKTLPDIMLTYRCSTFFGRIYAPEALLGFATDDELIDVAPMKDITPRQSTPAIDIKAISEKADMSIYESPDIETEPTPQPTPEQMDDHAKACVRLDELSEENKHLVDKFLAGRNPDNMTAGEVWGVVGDVEDNIK